MKGSVKGRPGIVMGVVALAVVGASVAGNLARRIGVVEPRVNIERGVSDSEAAHAATRLRLQVVQRAMNGEVAITANRLREAAALAAAASLFALNGRAPTDAKGGDLLRKMAARNMLPPGAALTEQPNALATPHGSLILYFRSMSRGRPVAPGVEVLSLGKDKALGPALIVRVAGRLPRAVGLKVWAATTLDRAQLPRPFAAEPEVIAAGWESINLRASQ
ncbi:MAG TPA: hypothetical protein VFS27_04620 [Blastocatellia bacterium]|jgi:hypothetical protein|nr:hypothetical protein [Blastocatellia bacterium]